MVSGYRKRLLASHMVAPERLKEEGSKEKKRECWSTRRWGSRDKGGGRRVHRKKKGQHGWPEGGESGTYMPEKKKGVIHPDTGVPPYDHGAPLDPSTELLRAVNRPSRKSMTRGVRISAQCFALQLMSSSWYFRLGTLIMKFLSLRSSTHSWSLKGISPFISIFLGSTYNNRGAFVKIRFRFLDVHFLFLMINPMCNISSPGSRKEYQTLSNLQGAPALGSSSARVSPSRSREGISSRNNELK